MSHSTPDVATAAANVAQYTFLVLAAHSSLDTRKCTNSVDFSSIQEEDNFVGQTQTTLEPSHRIDARLTPPLTI